MQLLPNDYRILRELLGWPDGEFPQGGLGVTTRDISERTGLHRNTVQRRLAALREAGVLEGFLYEPRPTWLGLVRAGHSFDGTAIRDRDHLASVLTPFPFVAIAALHAESCFLHTWHESETALTDDVEALREALGAREVAASFVSSRFPPHPSDGLKLTALDKRILLTMRRGFGRSADTIAEAVGVSRRTVSRRLARLADANAGALLPILRPSRIEGVVLVVYEAQERSDEARTSLGRAFPSRIMGPTGGGTCPMVLVPVANVDEAARRRAEAASLPGLSGLRTTLLRDWLFPPASDAWLAARVQDAPPGEAKA